MSGIAEHCKSIRNWNATSRDDSKHSVFPSVFGKKGDLLLLSMVFDDTAEEGDFSPPKGTELVNYVKGNDEAGFLYSKEFSSRGDTGEMITKGKGAAENKDALISLVLRGSCKCGINSTEDERVREEEAH